MFHRIVLVFSFVIVFCSYTSSQPIADEPENGRQPRQLDFGDCCPCPDKSTGTSGFREQGPWSAPAVLSPLPRSDDVDDCPCRSRSSDSEGFSSILFPTAMHAAEPFMKPTVLKEDPKNLLEPEVGLASSVLETLREATEEEYRDAVARDAARVRASEDATPEESARNIVTIVVSPKQADDHDDIPEASHIQESRCIHPIGSSLGRIRSPATNEMTEFLRVPKIKPGLLHRNLLHLDNSVGASNVQERVVDSNTATNKIKTYPALLRNNNDNECNHKSILGMLNEPLKQINTLDSNVFNRPFAPKVKLNDQLQRVNSANTRSSDFSPASDNVEEQLSEKQRPRYKLKSLLPVENNIGRKRPVILKNLLKLRDVEIISPTKLADREINNFPELKLPPLFYRGNKNQLTEFSDLIGKGIKLDFKHSNLKARKDCDEIEEIKPDENIQIIPQENTARTEIIDIIPSPSNINEIKDDDCDSQSMNRHQPSITIEQELEPETLPTGKATVADILDTISSTSVIHSHIVNNNSNDPDIIKSIDDQTDDKNTCSLSEESDPIEGEEISDSNETITNQNEEEQIIVNSDDYETDVSNNMETANTSCLEIIDQDSVFENNDNKMNEEFENENLDLESKSVEEDECVEKLDRNAKNNEGEDLSEKPTKHLSNKGKTTQLTNKLSFLQGDTVKKLGARSQLNSKFSDEDCQSDTSENVVTTTTTKYLTKNSDDTNNSLNRVNIHDLQSLSDSLLKMSMANASSKPTFKNIECDGENIATINSNKMESSKLLQDTFKTDESFENSANTISTSCILDDKSIPINNKAKDKGTTRTSIIENNIENSLQNDMESSKVSVSKENFAKTLGKSGEPNEMTAEASDPVMRTIHQRPMNLGKNTNFRSPVLPDIIVQPSSLIGDVFNSFDRPNSDGRGSLNLPTIDDIRERLSTLFGTEARTSNDELTDCPNKNPLMSVEGSNSHFQSKSPFEPLEDINLDIFQLKPLTVTKSNVLSEIPRLNLKSYKAKLPIPKHLSLKPMKLQSTLGNKGGVLGATLTISPESGIASKLSDALRKPLEIIPNLVDIRATMRANAESLLNSPLDLNKILFPDNLHPIQTIGSLSDHLKSHTENTLRDLEERMESTLKEVKSNDLLGDPMNKPQELLEKIADARDDLNDKLKGLHYDLNDRLTSLHENMFDQPRPMALNSPVLAGNTAQENTSNKINSRIRMVQRSSAPTLQRLELENKRASQNKLSSPKSKSNTQRNMELSFPQVKNVRGESKWKTFKMPAAASVPIPRSIELPKLKKIDTKFPSHFEKASSIKQMAGKTDPRHAENTRLSNLLRQPIKSEEKQPGLSKQTNLFKDSKFKVAFASTTPLSISKLKSKEFTTPRPIMIKKGNLRTLHSEFGRNQPFAKSQSNFFAGPNESPSEVKQSRLLSPESFSAEKESVSSEDGSTILNKVTEKHVPMSNHRPAMKTSRTLDVPGKVNFKSNVVTSNDVQRIVSPNKSSSKIPVPSLVWPKTEENSFLSKVREAVRSRLTNIDPLRITDARNAADKKNNGKHLPNLDMEKSASENSDLAIEESLKENISYRCRMVCTKET